VFKAGQWVHCGKVKGETFLEGRKVSLNSVVKLLKLTNQKCLADGSVLKKLEQFSEQGVERHFLKDGQVKVKIIPRLTRVKDAQNWLSMQPNLLRWYDYDTGDQVFGEVNDNNKLQGRGIRIRNYDDLIVIGYW
jgi:hypothetical protein